MARLDTFPDELLMCILELCSPSTSSLTSRPYRYKTYHNLCQVSRRLNQAATPFLYRTFEYRDSPSPSLAKLLRTLDRYPQLSNHIKTIRHDGYNDTTYHDHNPGDFDSAGVSAAEKTRLPGSTTPSWQQNGEDLKLSQLISQTQKLERLYIRMKAQHVSEHKLPIWLTDFARSALSNSFNKPNNVSSLRHLYIDVGGIDTASLFPMFVLPSLTHLALCHWGEFEAWNDTDEEGPRTISNQPWTWPNRTNNIESLTFKLPCVWYETISDAIRSCKALKRFELASSQLSPQRYENVLPALLEHADSLEELGITDSVLTRHTAPATLASLSSLHRLRTLRLPLPLVEPSTLPRNLQKLIIVLEEEMQPKPTMEPEPQPHHVSLLQELHQACLQHQFPSLKTIQLRIRFSCASFDRNIPEWRDLFKACNIRFEYYIQIALSPGRSRRSRERKEHRNYMETQGLVKEFYELPDVARVAWREEIFYQGCPQEPCKLYNIVATSLQEGVEDTWKKYDKVLDDRRWMLY